MRQLQRTLIRVMQSKIVLAFRNRHYLSDFPFMAKDERKMMV